MAQILRQVTVVRDGMHNAFTSLVHWQGMYWVAYRKADLHGASPIGEICLSVSADRTRFREVARVKVAGDNRDPRLVPMGEDRLALLFPSRPLCEDFVHQQHVSFSNDGYHWETPTPILEPRHHIFRAREHDGRFYGLDCYREPDVRRLFFLVSDDLLAWETVCEIGQEEDRLNESDVFFHEDGEAWVVARTKREPDHSMFCCSRPPYTEWQLTDLQTRIHAPAILEHDGALYVAGRNSPHMEGDPTWPFNSSLGVWKLHRGEVEPVLRIPATGDCSYPGFIKDPEGRVCISYYSQHAYHMGVVPPFDARVVSDGVDGAESSRQGYAADVYFAELELP